MEPISISLSQMKDKGSRYKRLIIILAISFILTSIAAYFIFYQENNPSIWILIGWGVYLLAYIYFGFVGYSKEMFVNADEFALEYQFGFFSKVPEKIIFYALRFSILYRVMKKLVSSFNKEQEEAIEILKEKFTEE